MEQLNPFDDPDQQCFVLANEQGQHSLWPAFAVIPAGWRQVHGPDSREACGQWVELNWTSLTAAEGGKQ